jgi:hypothetical protein
MALFPLGILSAAGAGGGVAGPAYELIETQVLGSSTPSITFSSLGTYSSTYKHLQIRITARSSRSSGLDGIALRLNSDTATNYSDHYLRGDGSTVTSGASTSSTHSALGIIPAASATNNVFGGLFVDLLDVYSTTKNKTIRSLYGMTTTNYVGLNSGLWRNTAAITSITLFQTEGANNLVAGSRFSLYGIKG